MVQVRQLQTHAGTRFLPENVAGLTIDLPFFVMNADTIQRTRTRAIPGEYPKLAPGALIQQVASSDLRLKPFFWDLDAVLVNKIILPARRNIGKTIAVEILG